MIEIALNRIISEPEPREWRDEQTFDSGDGIWKLQFNNPFEWHMGADGWHAKLFYNGKGVSVDNKFLKALGTGKGFHLPAKYSPWCHTEPVLALHPWDSTLHLYHADSHRSAQRKLVNFPLEIQWAPLGNMLAITHDGCVQILNKNGDDVASIPIRHPQSEYPETFWWCDGTRIFVVNRESRKVKTRISFFDSKDGRLLGSTDFDPLELLPYDQTAYSRIERDRYSLDIGSGTRCVGYLLDKWSHLDFDIDRSLLRGTVYRPEGPCEQRDGEYTCAAKERSVEIAIRA